MIGMRPGWQAEIRHRLWQARYALAALLLLVGLVAGLGVLGAWLEGRNVWQVSEDLALALTEALETSGRNALLANQRLEEAIAQRLLDHARLLDRLLQHVPLSNQLLAELAARNGLDRIEVLDTQGAVLASSAITLPAPMQEHLARHGMEMRGLPPMLRHWYEPLLRGQAQQALQGFGEQRFWLGRQYAVAIRRQAADDDTDLGQALSDLGACLTTLARYPAADSALAEGYAVLLSAEGADDERTGVARDRLIALYEAWGKPERAARVRSQA